MAAAQEYPAYVVATTLVASFLPARGLQPRGPPPTKDAVISEMENFGRVRLEATRARPRGARDTVIVFVLDAEGPYVHYAPQLRKLIENVGHEDAAKEGRIDEIMVVAPPAFFGRKNLTDVVAELRAASPAGPDPEGGGAYHNAYPYHNFALDISRCEVVPPHEIMTAAEVEALLRAEHIALGDLPSILATDPAIVWNGARPGQVVRITRSSQTAGVAVVYRRVV